MAFVAKPSLDDVHKTWRYSTELSMSKRIRSATLCEKAAITGLCALRGNDDAITRSFNRLLDLSHKGVLLEGDFG